MWLTDMFLMIFGHRWRPVARGSSYVRLRLHRRYLLVGSVVCLFFVVFVDNKTNMKYHQTCPVNSLNVSVHTIHCTEVCFYFTAHL